MASKTLYCINREEISKYNHLFCVIYPLKTQMRSQSIIKYRNMSIIHLLSMNSKEAK